MLGLSLLVVASALGLAVLAVRCQPLEHLLGAAVVAGVAFPLLFAMPVAGLGLLGACAATRRLVWNGPAVPDRLPSGWA